MDNLEATARTPDTRAPGSSPGTSVLSPVIIALAALLVLQLLAALAIGWGEGPGRLAPSAPDTPLLAFDPAGISRIRIEDGEGAAVTLEQRDKRWVLADPEGFPSADGKADALIAKLHGLKRPLPTATSEGALKRFRLADDAFERRVTLESDGKAVATLVVGDSPGFKRLFARPAGETAVYDLELPLIDVSSGRDDWLAKDQLRLDQEKITGVATADWALTREGDSWRLAGAEGAVDEDAVAGIIARVANLGYRGVLGAEEAAGREQDEPVLELSIERSGGEQSVYRISRVADSEDYLLRDAERPFVFKLSKLDLEGIIDMDQTKLLVKAIEDSDTSAGAQPPEQAGSAADEGSREDNAPGDAAQAPDANPEQSASPASTDVPISPDGEAEPSDDPVAPPGPERP